jgi:FkbM family methyltransferase
MNLLNNIKIFIKRKLMFNNGLFYEKNRNRFFGIRNGQAIDCFFDVGANVGAFPVKFSQNMEVVIKNVVYVEPDDRCLSALQNTGKRALFDDFQIENVCLGSADGEIEFYKTENSAQNSVLPPVSFEAEKSLVKLVKGNELVEKYVNLLGVHNVLKVDVQGLEVDVLKGFGDSLSKFSFIICEISIEEFYEQQSSYLDIFSYLSKTHSYVGDFSRVHRDDGRLSYMNSCFQLNDKAIS